MHIMYFIWEGACMYVCMYVRTYHLSIYKWLHMYLGDEHVCIYCIHTNVAHMYLSPVNRPWMKMSAHMSMHLRTPTFGVWEISYWEYVIGTFDDYTKGCPFSSKLVRDWNLVLC